MVRRILLFALLFALLTVPAMAQSEGYNEQETIFRYEKAFLSTIKPILWMLGGDYLFSDGPQPIDHSAELPHPLAAWC